MDFLNPKKKRAHRRRLVVGYALMGTLITMATLVLFFAAYGYDIDRKNGGIIQNGLIIIDAHPEPTQIILNGKESGTTSDRLVVPEGMYEIELKRDGYRSWKHSISLEGSSIEQLIYPVLFPTKLVTKQLQNFESVPSLASASPDRHWLIVQTPASATSFTSIDLSDNKNPSKQVTLPSGIVTDNAGADSFEAVEWAGDNVHLLLKHTFAEGSEFVLLNHENPPASVNLTKLFSAQPFTAINLRDKKFNQYYLHNAADGNVFTANTANPAPTLFISKVLAYKSYQANTILYATNPSNNPNTVEVHVRQGDQDNFLRTLPLAPGFLLDIAEFGGSMYIVSGSPADGKNYLYKNPLQDFHRRPARTPQPFRVMIVPGAQYISFSANARFVAVQSGSAFVVYDAETSRQSRYDLKIPLAPNQKSTWMDGHRLTLNSGGNVLVFDFDGTNIQTLSASLAGFPSFFDRDYTAMFNIAPDTAAPQKILLTRTALKAISK
jgi:hypothetical protein